MSAWVRTSPVAVLSSLAAIVALSQLVPRHLLGGTLWLAAGLLLLAVVLLASALIPCVDPVPAHRSTQGGDVRR